MAGQDTAPIRKTNSLRPYLGGILLLLCAAGGLFVMRENANAPAPEVIGPAPAFALTTASGSILPSESLTGSVWVMNFFFTSCPGPCPLINTELKKLTTIPWLRDKVRILSVTVDPARDTPEKLAEYGKRFGALGGRWDFLTGSEAEIRALIERDLKLIAPDDVSMHTTRIVLVDRGGNIRGFYQGAEQEGLRQLFRDVSTIVRN